MTGLPGMQISSPTVKSFSLRCHVTYHFSSFAH